MFDISWVIIMCTIKVFKIWLKNENELFPSPWRRIQKQKSCYGTIVGWFY